MTRNNVRYFFTQASPQLPIRITLCVYTFQLFYSDAEFEINLVTTFFFKLNGCISGFTKLLVASFKAKNIVDFIKTTQTYIHDKCQGMRGSHPDLELPPTPLPLSFFFPL